MNDSPQLSTEDIESIKKAKCPIRFSIIKSEDYGVLMTFLMEDGGRFSYFLGSDVANEVRSAVLEVFS